MTFHLFVFTEKKVSLATPHSLKFFTQINSLMREKIYHLCIVNIYYHQVVTLQSILQLDHNLSLITSKPKKFIVLHMEVDGKSFLERVSYF